MKEKRKPFLTNEKAQVISFPDKFITLNKEMKDIVKKAKKIAVFDIDVLITGESGVGKGILARLIHNQSKKEGNFIILNSAGLPETLLESELFGYKKGAFTGASSNQIGFFEKAQGGTLFMDEIGDMSLTAQSKILLAIEEREFYPIGSRKKITVNTRLISASNQPLQKLVKKNKFRSDLFYRLAGIHFHIPPLRERPEDITALTSFFVNKSSLELNKKITVSKDVHSFFLDYEWPGNIREMKNLIRQAAFLSQKNVLEVNDFKSLKNNFTDSDKNSENNNCSEDSILDFKINVNKCKKNLIIKVLKITNWNQTKAAKLMGIQRTYLARMIRRYKIKKRRN